MKRLLIKYFINVTQDAHDDILTRGSYIFKTYGYPTMVEGFEKRIYKAIRSLEYFPSAYAGLDERYRGNKVHYKSVNKNIIVYAVDYGIRTVYILRVFNKSSMWYEVISHYLKD